MSQRQRPTRKPQSAPKKAARGINNSSNVKGNRPRKQDNARRQMQNQQGSFNQPVGASAAYSTGVSTTRPKISMGNNMCNVKHKEFIGNVTGSSAFTQSFELSLNPGIAATFPWLSVMAQNWQAYRFKKLRFYYLTRTGSNIPGSVILCPDYDAADVAPISEQVIDSYEDAKEDAPWKNIDCPLNPIAMHLLGPKKFIRLGNLPANQDVKTFDVGNMFVYTVDGTAVNWGKVWVEYDVDLYTPQLPPGGSSFTQVAPIVGATSTTAAEPLGTAPVVTGNMQVVAGNNGTNSTLVISNAIVGAEYSLNVLSQGTVITGAVTVSSYAGANAKTALSVINPAATESVGFNTFTAVSSPITIVLSGTATTITLTEVILALIPTSSF
jgi:hypothetical protein